VLPSPRCPPNSIENGRMCKPAPNYSCADDKGTKYSLFLASNNRHCCRNDSKYDASKKQCVQSKKTDYVEKASGGVNTAVGKTVGFFKKLF
jgi:hypothetical protein